MIGRNPRMFEGAARSDVDALASSRSLPQSPCRQNSKRVIAGVDMSNVSLPRMPWYPSDFAGATRDWPLVARAIYRELLDAQWDMGSIPAVENTLRMMIRATSKEWKEGWPLVRSKFAQFDDGRLRNLRLEKHRDYAVELSKKRKLAADKRWENHNGGPGDEV